MNRRLWTSILAGIAALGLLLAFYLVVSGAVVQGHARQRATASLADATWRCNAEHGSSARGSCLVQLAAANDNAGAARPPVQTARVGSPALR